MKKTIKIGALSLLLVASLLMINNNKTHAAVGQVTFTISWAAGSSCTYGTAWNTSTPLSVSASAQNADSSLSNFTCTDNVGANTWAMTLLSASTVTNWTTAIPATGVSMQTTTSAVTNPVGGCTASSNTTTYAAISPTPITILWKASPTNGICTVTTSTVQLRVAVPAYATPGAYTWTLTLAVPSF